MASATPSSSSSGSAGRGGRWVVAQFIMMPAVIAAGILAPHWPSGWHELLSVFGAVLAGVGIGFAVWAGRTLGRSLTPFPKPVPNGLATGGPFAFVRHPIYSGGLLLFAGYSLYASIPALVLTVALGVLWAGKSRLEERLLAEAYPGYGAYVRAVRWRLVPFVY